jgi:hypothetical protein
MREVVIWREEVAFVSIGSKRRNLRLRRKNICSFSQSCSEELAMNSNCTPQESFEISPRFRQTVEERIARLARDAANDEAQLDRLDDIDHIRRQMRLVAAQRSEALRMRIFLDRARMRSPRPLIQL